MMVSFLRLAAIGAVLLTGATAAQADTGVVSFTDGPYFGSYNGTDLTIGFEFSTASAIDVSSLGWYAASGTTNASHEVGIWDTSGTLLGSTTVTAGATGADDFRFASVSTFTLAAGDYFIGGEITSPYNDNYTTEASNLVTGTGITFIAAARSGTASGFADPSITEAAEGRFGPNFEFTAAAAPEPGTWTMLIAGFAGVGATMRYRRRGPVSAAA
jgi:hypothetical protein